MLLSPEAFTSQKNNSCTRVLTKVECFKALQTFKNGKSPGNNGLKAEFYQVFCPTLGHLLVDSLKCT